jgi:hypothetical protein
MEGWVEAPRFYNQMDFEIPKCVLHLHQDLKNAAGTVVWAQKIYGPWANPISTMAPASVVFPDPLFLFQTPDENDE